MAFDLSRRDLLTGALALGAAACHAPLAQASPRPATDAAKALIAAARRQIGVTMAYDPAYSTLAFPNGDVPRERGVCTDVVIRAFRDALGLDLQSLVHRDMAANFAAYPRRWGLARPDRNIDHRRVPNLERFWERSGARLPLPAQDSLWQPGDIFTSLVGGNLPHTGIVSDRLSASGAPMVIHNIGGGAHEDELAVAQKLTRRFRWRV
ncbi:MAG: DUF1287 domain-containing protein [Novosphingobium sp.]